MDLVLGPVAESLSWEFEDLPSSAVVAVLRDCADEFASVGPDFIEQVAVERLAMLREPRRRTSAPRVRDSLDVSLHERDLAEEVELTVRLMIAANESDRPLAQAEVDEILEVQRPVRPVVPQQVTCPPY